eukprot:423234_1
MGGLCAGGVPGVPSAPEIDVDMEQVADLIKNAIEEIPDKVRENCENFPGEIQKADPNPFCVPDTTVELTKDSNDETIAMAAITAAFASHARDTIKNLIWEQIEPSIDEQLNKVEGLPQKIKDTTKDKFKEKTIDVAVDKALNEALQKK